MALSEVTPYKKTREEGCNIVFLDESGFMLQLLLRQGRARRGETPIQRQWERHDRRSVIGAITAAPRRNRTGPHWTANTHNTCGEDVVPFCVASNGNCDVSWRPSSAVGKRIERKWCKSTFGVTARASGWNGWRLMP